MGLAARYNEVINRIGQAAQASGRNPADIRLVAVSKYVGPDAVAELANLGQLDFGENRIQDCIAKMGQVRADVRWHMVGRIQTNKIKHLTGFHLIHSLDRWPLAEKMSGFAQRKGIEFSCLVQVNVSGDGAKAGVDIREAGEFVCAAAELPGLKVLGLMTITALGAEDEQVREWYQELAALYHRLQHSPLPNGAQMKWLSMGMSDDYPLAIAAGANLVRVGSAIFRGKEQ